MIRPRFPRISVFAAVAVLACADPTTSPDSKSLSVAGPVRSVAVAGQANGRHLVTFNGAAPADFAGRVAALGGSVTRTISAIGIAAVEGLSDAAAVQLAASSGIARVDANGDVQLEPTLVEPPEAAGTDVIVSSAAQPNLATRFARQWHLRAIQADQAWAAGYLGSSAVKVFILDTGIDYRHLDLAGRVDLALSKSFIPSDDAVVAATFPGAHPIADLHFHGTHVGATVSSNAIVTAGVTSRVTLVGVKVLSRTGSGPWDAILAGIAYAADNGADVINMSLGASFGKAGNGAFMASLNRATNYAFSKGTVVVVSAGNSAIDLDHDGNGYKVFCSSPNVVCVSATGPTAGGTAGPWVNVDALAGYSNYGRSSISVAAPGGNSGGFVWAPCSGFSMQTGLTVCQTGTFIVGSTGTSMASPHVAGVAALLVEKLGANNPAQVRAALAKTSDDLGQAGVDPAYGRGRVNAFRAVSIQ